MDRWLEYLRTSFFLALLSAILVQRAVPSYESDLTALLQKTVNEDGLVDYATIRSELATLDSILDSIANYSGPLENHNQKKAFWINAYNAYMLTFIAEAPEVRDIVADGYADKFFKTPVAVAGRELSLDDIEHKILRRTDPSLPQFLVIDRLDPRIHVGLNCGAISCPSLPREAFSENTVEALLDARMRVFVNAEKHVRIDDQSLVISSLLDWFGDDWDSTGVPAGDYLIGFMDEDRPDYDKIRHLLAGKSAREIGQIPNVRFEYDWIVNGLSFH